MKQYQKDFIELAIQNQALLFGDFTLKSGRQSPYFFNISKLNSGYSIHLLGTFYAQAIIDANISFDMLFGPAYKGIPLVTTTAIALYQKFNKQTVFTFNRKERKNHGEQGILVGPALTGKIIILDDVITAGTAAVESLNLINNLNDAVPAAIIVAFDRQEKGNDTKTTTKEIEETYHIPCIAISKVEHMLEYMKGKSDLHQHISLIENHYLKNKDPN